MKTETICLDEKKNVTLTSYILDTSNEMRTYQKRPAILVFPGGGYRFCSDREAEPIAMAFLAEGYNAFVLRYSINEHSIFPSPLEDAENALSLIREKADEYNIIPDRIAVVGFSAGGHLAAAVGTMGKVRPDAMILCYPCIMDTLGDVLYAPVPSLEKEVDNKTPPCFIAATYQDTLVPVEHSLEFATALNKMDIPFEMHVFTFGGHGYSLAKPHTADGRELLDNRDYAQWVPMCINWLDKVMLKKVSLDRI